ISTVYNLDWPSKKGLSQLQQKQEFIYLLDKLKKTGLNAVIVQIKPSADSFYPSQYAPWSEYLTGVQGQNPGYNPLSFMIEETHKRGMEFHAWFNPYRVSVKNDTEKLAADHPARKNPDWVVSYGNKLYYNPGISEVRQFVIDSILEVVRNYNIDGVHLDDYFYPYPESGIDFPDDQLYKANKRFAGETKAQWRRNNINDFIENLYKSIKREKAGIKFGVSPFGIWRNRADDSKGSDTRGGITSYGSLYADTKYWVEKEWLDYIVPQIYWNFGYDRADYGVLVDWWADITKGRNVHLYIGHAAHKVEKGDTPWGNPLEIINQIKYNRDILEVKGSIFFRAKSIVDNPLGLADRLGNDVYKKRVETP
ncbi:MAG TPA: family 10 glycosylhydrolase, partial [Oscillospiraceae bacterium]|nr:family 10 glycosylhydrolase [Oscillospiraceae bacterium]